MIELDEFRLLSQVLESGVAIRYGQNEIEVLNTNDPSQSRSVHVPSELVPTVKDFLRNPRVMAPEQWIEIREYVFEVFLTIIWMLLRASTPKERELKSAVLEEFLKRVEQARMRA